MFSKSIDAVRRFMRRCGAGLAVSMTLAAGVAFAAGVVPLDEKGFTEFLARSFAAAMPEYEVNVLALLALGVRADANEPKDAQIFYLQTIYSFCLRNPANCDFAVANHVAQMSAGVKDAKSPVDRSRLRGVVRTKAYVDAIRRKLDGDGEIVAVPLIGDLWAVCMLDLPTAMQVMRPSHLERLNLTRDAAIALCKKNVATELSPLETAARMDKSGKFGILSAGNPYESSRLLFPESWAPLAERMGRHLIVAAPAHDAVLFADDRDAKAVAKMQKRVREIGAKAFRPISPTILTWTPSGWRVARDQGQ